MTEVTETDGYCTTCGKKCRLAGQCTMSKKDCWDDGKPALGYDALEDMLLNELRDKPAELRVAMLYFEHMRYFHDQYTLMMDKLITFMESLGVKKKEEI